MYALLSRDPGICLEFYKSQTVYTFSDSYSEAFAQVLEFSIYSPASQEERYILDPKTV